MSSKFSKSRLQVAIKRGVLAMAETKEVLLTICTNQVVNHNSVVNLYNNAFLSTVGSQGEQEQAGGSGCRIGTKIFIKGINVALHIEGQQYRPRTHWKLFLVRNRLVETDITTKDQIYEGTNTNIMLDWIDPKKVDIIYSKCFVVTMPNVGTSLPANTGAGVLPDPVGVFDHESSSGAIWTVSTNPSWRGKFYVPINMNITYTDLTQVPARMRYQWVIQAYDNYGAPSSGSFWTTYPVGHVSMQTKMKFKDI